jgi:predicted nucleic acid-binding Zn ribbon protein
MKSPAFDIPRFPATLGARMATYLYETTDPRKPVRRFELQQSMKDAPLTHHPETGEAVRRLITGGLGVMVKGTIPAPPPECGRGACPRCAD